MDTTTPVVETVETPSAEDVAVVNKLLARKIAIQMATRVAVGVAAGVAIHLVVKKLSQSDVEIETPEIPVIAA